MSDRTVDTLGHAFREYRTPFENQRFIAEFVAKVDAAALLRYSDHFRIERRSGEPALQVHHGSTIGFRSKEEVEQLVGDAGRFPSEWLPGCWGVNHPVEANSGSGGRNRSPRQVPTSHARNAARYRRSPDATGADGRLDPRRRCASRFRPCVGLKDGMVARRPSLSRVKVRRPKVSRGGQGCGSC